MISIRSIELYFYLNYFYYILIYEKINELFILTPLSYLPNIVLD